MIPFTWSTLSSQSHKDRKHYWSPILVEPRSPILVAWDWRERKKGICCLLSTEFAPQDEKSYRGDSPSGPVVGNSPGNAGDIGLIPGWGWSFMPQGNWAHVPQLLKPTRLEPVLCNNTSHYNDCIAREKPLLATTRKSLCPAMKT